MNVYCFDFLNECFFFINISTSCKNAILLPPFGQKYHSQIFILQVSCMFLGAHVTTIAVATWFDPVDDNAKGHIYNKNRVVPVFDRSTRRHVIEGDYCFICEVIV